MDRFSRRLKSGAATAALTLGIMSGAMANAVKTGADFEQTLVNAAVKFPGSIRLGTKEFEVLESAARKVGSTTEFTASQSAEALNFLAMAGFNSAQAVASLPQVVDLATTAQIGLGEATDIASDALGAFNLMTKDTSLLTQNLARVSDVMAKTTTSANTNMQMLFETMKEGGPVAVTAGANIETFSALSGILADAGIKASQAGTTLKNVFLRLQAPTPKGQGILSHLGVQTKDAQGNLRDITRIIDDLNKATKNLGTADKGAVLEGIFGKIPIAGVNILLNSGGESIRRFRTELESATGASNDMSAVMRNTMMGRLKALNSAVEGVKISLFSMNNGPLSETIESMTEWVRTNEQLLAQKIGNFINDVIEGLQFLGRHRETIFNFVKWMGLLIFSFKTFSAVMAIANMVMLANPIGLVVAAIAGMVVAIGSAIIWWDQLVSAFNDLPASFKVVVNLLTSPFRFLINSIKFVISLFTDLDRVIDTINQNLGEFTKIVTNPIGALSDSLGLIDVGGDSRSRRASLDRSRSPQATLELGSSSSTSIERNEVVIRDETGRAEIEGRINGSGLSLIPSGTF